MKVYYSDTFELPLPEDHHFPLDKYRLLREQLQASEFANHLDFQLPPAATDEQLLLVHIPDYLQKVTNGHLSRVEQRRIGFPWSQEMVERHRRSTGATISAAKAALRDGQGAHLAGGTHHAFANRGEGFCVFNDVAVAIRVLQGEGAINRATIIDLDVHQGNGTAEVFSDDADVFTFSMHGERNFPASKTGSDCDIQLADGTSDTEYLDLLKQTLQSKLPLSESDIVFYIAGADCYEKDRYGRLSLTKKGLAKRDQLVFQACNQMMLPTALVMGGGYARELDDVVDINFETIRELVKHSNTV